LAYGPAIGPEAATAMPRMPRTPDGAPPRLSDMSRTPDGADLVLPPLTYAFVVGRAGQGDGDG
jgi:hypothetical protein